MTGRHELSQPLRDLADGVPISDPTNLLIAAAHELDAMTGQIADLVFRLDQDRGLRSFTGTKP